MKYFMLWVGVIALLGLIAAVGWIGYKVVLAVSADPSLWWVPLAVFAIPAVATIVAVVDYLSDHPSPPKGDPTKGPEDL